MAEWLMGGRQDARGPFDNPAGLAFSLCCTLSLCRNVTGTGSCRSLRIIGICIISLAIMATNSRIGIITLAIVLFVRLFIYKRFILITVIVVTIVVAFCVLMSQKTGSTSGRMFILRNSWGLIHEHPLQGWGRGGFRREYMLQQASFLSKHPDSNEAWLADDINHPLNEYILAWVDYGVIGLIGLSAILFFPIISSRERELRLSCLVVSIFALASYPFHLPIAWMVIGTGWLALSEPYIRRVNQHHWFHIIIYILTYTIGIAIIFHSFCTSRQQVAERASEAHQHKRALRIYKSLEPLCHHDPYYLYAYSRECFTIGRFDDALRLNDLCHIYWSSYDLTLLRADILLHLERYIEAEGFYKLAYSMCPIRFAPLEGLLHVYEKMDDTTKVRVTAQKIIKKPIKVPSKVIDDIKHEARVILSNIDDL